MATKNKRLRGIPKGMKKGDRERLLRNLKEAKAWLRAVEVANG